MRKCLKIKVMGNVQANAYRSYIQKIAKNHAVEGVVQVAEEDSILIYACGYSDKLDMFIDDLYNGNPEGGIKGLIAEPFIKEKDFRGVFRIIGD